MRKDRKWIGVWGGEAGEDVDDSGGVELWGWLQFELIEERDKKGKY